MQHSLEVAAEGDLLASAERIFDLVWRADFSSGGFAVLTATSEIDSRTLRSWMLALQRRLSAIGVEREFGQLGIRSFVSYRQRISSAHFYTDTFAKVAPLNNSFLVAYWRVRR